MKTLKLRRQISVFDRTSEHLVQSVPLSDATFNFIRERLKVPPSDPMYDSYPIEIGLIQELQIMIELPIYEKCDYYLETEVCDSSSL